MPTANIKVTDEAIDKAFEALNVSTSVKPAKTIQKAEGSDEPEKTEKAIQKAIKKATSSCADMLGKGMTKKAIYKAMEEEGYTKDEMDKAYTAAKAEVDDEDEDGDKTDKGLKKSDDEEDTNKGIKKSVKKGDDEDEDDVEKALGSNIAELEKALAAKKLEMANHRKNRMGFDPEELVKSVADELETRQKKVNQANGLVLKSLVDGVKENADDLYDLSQKVDEIYKAINAFMGSSVGRKSISGTTAFKEKYSEVEKAEGGEKTLSVTKDRGKIIDIVEQKIDRSQVGKNDYHTKLAGHIAKYETAGYMEKSIEDVLTQQGYTVVL